MPPKQRVVVQSSPVSRRNQPTGYLGGIYHELTAPENRSVVRSIAIFGAAVAFFSSSWSEFLLPV